MGNLKMLEEIRKGSDRWKRDGLTNLAFRIINSEDDTVDAATVGITYHHVKVRRGHANFDLSKVYLATSTALCGSSEGLQWTVAPLGKDVPMHGASIRAQALAQQGCPSQPGADSRLPSIILLDRRRHLAKILKDLDDDAPRMIVQFYRSLESPSEDGLIIADPRTPEALQEAFVRVGAFAAPPSDYRVCQSKLQNGHKYSIHEGSHCGGGGWEQVQGGGLRAFARPREGFVAVSWCDNPKYWTQKIVKGQSCPEQWADLKWQHGGTFWVPKGDSFCVGTRSGPAHGQEKSFSEMLPKPRCDQEGFQHQFTFGSVAAIRDSTQSPPPLTITICRKASSKTSTITADGVDCEKLKVLARFPALDAAAAGEFDRVLCVSKGQTFKASDDCGEFQTFKFAVPQSAEQAREGSAPPRMRICRGSGAKDGFAALGVGDDECSDTASPDSSFEAPSILEMAASTPQGEASTGAPLYELLDEARPCYSFICKNTKV